MKHYTDIIPISLAKKLKEKGMSMQDAYIPILYDKPESIMSGYIIPTYGACLDWLMSEKNIYVNIYPIFEKSWQGDVLSNLISNDKQTYYETTENTWHEAAEAAIEKALTLI